MICIYYLILLIILEVNVKIGYIPEWMGELAFYGGVFVGLVGILLVNWYWCDQGNAPDNRK